eukprot:NODE_30207_length_425_cov_0.620805.p3 GENE.NODE_30207_length_425_cov_0.620805~~NODE_30207_length_425_cov_0.620805.p3  ORF type:complete len:87 (+),score=17.66 NODE_30207_length_425_cov_0.620805:91-351(+)
MRSLFGDGQTPAGSRRARSGGAPPPPQAPAQFAAPATCARRAPVAVQRMQGLHALHQPGPPPPGCGSPFVNLHFSSQGTVCVSHHD